MFKIIVIFVDYFWNREQPLRNSWHLQKRMGLLLQNYGNFVSSVNVGIFVSPCAIETTLYHQKPHATLV